MMNLSQHSAQIDDLIERALDEDIPGGDITTETLLSGHIHSRANFLAKSSGIQAGIEIARLVMLKVDPFLKFTLLLRDGSNIKPGDTLAIVEGDITSILKAERTSLNFLQHLSGIATTTAQYVEIVKDLPVKILDTRKTIPGLRILEKYAVNIGGGQNHRLSLSDMVLIKDNHIAILRRQGLSINDMVERARRKVGNNIKIEVESTSPREAVEAAQAGADIVMLDNMRPNEMQEAVRLINRRAKTEASGGVNLNTLRMIAETGVDYISVGAITHSTKALDISLDLDADYYNSPL